MQHAVADRGENTLGLGPLAIIQRRVTSLDQPRGTARFCREGKLKLPSPEGSLRWKWGLENVLTAPICGAGRSPARSHRSTLTGSAALVASVVQALRAGTEV